MAGKALALGGPIRIADYLSLGLLARLVPPVLVDQALTEHGKGQFTADGQFPIGHQLIPVKLYSCLHKPQLLPRQIPYQYFPVRDSDRSLELGILGMNMWQVMMLIVDKVHPDNDSIEH